MNYRLLFRNIGLFTSAFTLLLIPSALWAVWFREWETLVSFGESAAVALAAGLLLMLAGRGANAKQMFQRETLGMVGIGWLAAAAVGALPYFFSGTLDGVDSYFESMSGLTTTGSTVIADIEGCAKSILFWRSFTHWVGGMGIIVLFIAVLPYLGVGGKQLFKSESSANPQALSPRIKDTASALWRIYLGMTVLQTILLMAAGMSFFDALCHTFGTLATGGFSPKQASIAHYNSFLIEAIIMFFMVASATNFALYFAMLRGKRLALLHDTEWRALILILGLAIGAITLNLMGFRLGGTPDAHETAPYGFVTALRNASFISISIMTSTGFGQDNYETWPWFSQLILFGLMMTGGCVGSTSGGLKVFRLVVVLKMIYWRLENAFRPKTVRPIRMGEAVIDDDAQRRVTTHCILYLFIIGMGGLLLSGMGLPPLSAVSAVATTLGGVGPGMELVGPAHDFSQIADAGKLLLCLCMAMGRLEMFAILVLFVPGFWKHS
ncbi:MAG: TrkH family potassium uptake protein [Candidatus Hydrogenedens sp.]|nr:TrkH family potassium uptake protein [Candidatus Hydrogenedens sp.]